MRILLVLALFISSVAHAEYEFEKSKFKSSKICLEMVGTWFTDITVNNTNDGRKRDITRLDRKADGTAYIKGISIYYKTNEIVDWEFASKWSCDGEWYVESNQWGYTAFKIISFEDGKNNLMDERNNLSAPKPTKLVEVKKLSEYQNLKKMPKISKFLGL